MRKLNLFLFLLLFFIVGFLLGKSYSLPPKQTNYSDQNNNTVDLAIWHEDSLFKEYKNVPFLDEETLFALTKRQAEEDNFAFDYSPPKEYGILVVQIGEKKNGQDNKYWQYWVNNEQVQISADQYYLRPGDDIVWKFTTSEFWIFNF